VCSIVNIVYPFRIGTQTNGKALFTRFPRLLKREKGNITLYHVPGLASAFSHFRGLAAAMLDGLARSRDRTLSSVYALLCCQGTLCVIAAHAAGQFFYCRAWHFRLTVAFLLWLYDSTR
jgi:hypothetical protein